jgi:hypothetical protein
MALQLYSRNEGQQNPSSTIRATVQGHGHSVIAFISFFSNESKFLNGRSVSLHRISLQTGGSQRSLICRQDTKREGRKVFRVACFGVCCKILRIKCKIRNTEHVYYNVDAVVAIIMKKKLARVFFFCKVYKRNFLQLQLPT